MSNSEKTAIEFMKARTESLKLFLEDGIKHLQWIEMFDLNEEYWVGE